MSRTVAIIPARYASTRLPGKPLVEIAGKAMIQHVYERVQQAARVNRVVVATDDERIREYVAGFGGEVVMTSSGHATGSDRVAEAALMVGDVDIVVNVQGDEPLVEPVLIGELVAALETSKADCATPIALVTSNRDLFDAGCVKVALRGDFSPLYFSRSPIPAVRDSAVSEWVTAHTFYRHIGLYAYRAESLQRFVAAPQSPLERAEQLEQLRMLEIGMKLHCLVTEYEGCPVDTPEDVMRVEAKMQASARK